MLSGQHETWSAMLEADISVLFMAEREKCLRDNTFEIWMVGFEILKHCSFEI
jgi:hypothetical protein